MGVYARILRTPGVMAIVAATVVGRLPIGISGLAILLYVQEVRGSFAAAGACAGALALAAAALGGARADPERLRARLGPHRADLRSRTPPDNGGRGDRRGAVR